MLFRDLNGPAHRNALSPHARDPVNLHLNLIGACVRAPDNHRMAITKIALLSIGDLTEELVALGAALQSGKPMPNALRTLQDVTKALTALSAENRRYEAALRAAIDGLAVNAQQLQPSPLAAIQFGSVLGVGQKNGPHAGR